MNFIDLNSIVKDIDNLYAHRKGQRMETLREHLDNCSILLKYINDVHGVEDKLRKTLLGIEIKKQGKVVNLSNEDVEFALDMFFNTIYLHDIGKINPKFQIDKMNNCKFNNVKSITSIESHHAPLSSIIFINEYSKRMRKEPLKEKLFLRTLMLYLSNLIYCHHGNLENLEDKFSEDSLEEIINTYALSDYLTEYKGTISFNKGIADVFKRIGRNDVGFNTQIVYVITKIANSLLIGCDFTSTHCFLKNIDINDFRLALIDDVEPMIKAFKATEVYNGMMNYKNDKNYFRNNKLPVINELRSDIALECSSNIEKYKFLFNLFNIEAPTGSGKTYNSLGCALNLLEIKEFKRLFCISPINAISSQTIEEYQKIFKNIVEIQEINSLTPLPVRLDSTGTIDYEKTLLDRQLLNYQVTFTSHIALFDILFGTSRESSMGLFQFFNSVVILDEIQNYKNLIWKETIEMLNTFSEIMNIKIIIMSATLPNLQKLIRQNNRGIIDLLNSPEKYYKNPSFKDRVTVDGSMLNKKVSFDDLRDVMVNSIEKRHKLHPGRGQIFLAEFIRKQTAMDFYKKIKGELSSSKFEIYELDSNNSIYSKNELISKIKKYNGSKHLILITTQVIEAGVDIDADLGMKDAVFPDVDEQFMGRINRSGTKRDCVVFFFNFDNEQRIYKEDLRCGSNIKDIKYLSCLKEKQFKSVLYKMVIDKIEELKTLSFISSINKFDKEHLYGRYRDIQKRMKLIDDNTFTIYIPISSITINDNNGSVVTISGMDTWKEYTYLMECEGIKHAERKFKLSVLTEKMSFFTYSIYGQGLSDIEPIGGIYYIKDGEHWINEGKLDMEQFKNAYNIIK